MILYPMLLLGVIGLNPDLYLTQPCSCSAFLFLNYLIMNQKVDNLG